MPPTQTDITQRLIRARELLRIARNAALATVNSDGSPHNTPVYFALDNQLHYMYWSSHPASLHSINLQRTGQIFVAIYEATSGGGLYIAGEAALAISGTDLASGLIVFNNSRSRDHRSPMTVEQFTDLSPQRLYRARLTSFYINVAERSPDGQIVQDKRHEILPADLLS